jgi:SAM-dependent methyltransferase
MTYNAGKYWDERLAKDWSLRGVGHHRYGAKYNSYLYRSKVRALRRALRSPGWFQGKRVLDVGSGVGFWIEFYAKAGVASVDGIDVSAEAVRRLQQKHPGHRFWCADASEELPITELFDLVNVWDVLYHITERERFMRAVSNLAARVAPGGHLLITDNLPSQEDRPAEHVCFHPLEDYRVALEHTGCQIVDVQPVCGLVNGRVFDRLFRSSRVWRKRTARLEDRAAPLLYFLDGIWMSPRVDNLKLLTAYRPADRPIPKIS